MSLKWKQIIDEHAGALHSVFYFTVTYQKTLEDGSTKTYTFLVDIPDMFAKIHSGNKKVSKVIKDMYYDDPVVFINTDLATVIQTVADPKRLLKTELKENTTQRAILVIILHIQPAPNMV